LQVELMRRHRKAPALPADAAHELPAAGLAESPTQRLRRGIHLSINGIASALRNTG
jgi:phosphoenolpyruvate carboxylase